MARCYLASVTTLGDLSLASNVDGIDGPASIRGDNVVLRDGSSLTAGGAITLSSTFGSPDGVMTFGSLVALQDEDPTISLGQVTIDAGGDVTFNAAMTPAGALAGSLFPNATGAPLEIISGGLVTFADNVGTFGPGSMPDVTIRANDLAIQGLFNADLLTIARSNLGSIGPGQCGW